VRQHLAIHEPAGEVEGSFGVVLGTDFDSPWVADGFKLHPDLVYRAGIRWVAGEPNAPVGGVHTYNWNKADSFFDVAIAADARVLIVLSNGPAWACPGGPNFPISPSRITDYAAWCTAVAGRYGAYPGIVGYEVWNEPNLGSNGPWTAAEYKAALLPAAAAIRSVVPSAVIAGPVLAGTAGDSGWTSFTKPLVNDPDVSTAIDVFSGHTYCRPFMPEVGDGRGPIDDRLSDGNINLASVGWTKPVWITEGGYPTPPATTSNIVSLEDQARFLVRMAILVRSHADKFFVFHLYDSGPLDNARAGEGIIDRNDNPKPSYFALQKCFARLGQSKPVRKADQNGARVYTFATGAVAWITSGSAEVTIAGITKTVSTDPIWW
jgi:Cellulase (glycosyl hydrolase family 5)